MTVTKMCVLCPLVLVLVLFSSTCRGQAMCRYVFEPTNSTITGLCQKIVFSPEQAKACYWFQTDQNSQDQRIPYVGVLQVVPTPGGEAYTALCVFQRHIPTFSEHNSFVVSFSPDFSSEFSTERFVEPSFQTESPDTSTQTEESVDNGSTVTRTPRRLDPVSGDTGDSGQVPKVTGDDGGDSSRSAKDTALVVLGCLAAVAIPGFLLLAALRYRNHKRLASRKEQSAQEPHTDARRFSITALRRSDRPDSFFGISNPSSSTSDDVNDAAMTSFSTRRRQSVGQEKAVRFVEGTRMIPSRMYLPEVHSYIRARSYEEDPEEERPDSPSKAGGVWTTGREHRDELFDQSSEPDLLY